MPRRRRRRRPNWLARWIVGMLLAASAAYLLIPSYLEFQRLEAMQLRPSYLKLVEQQTARWLGTLWFAFVGGSVGSFLNVVVWRVPRGRSLMGRSHCPWCTVQIKSRDNVPVLGWVWLRGRCRACRLPIAPRYPLVELFMACLFLFVLAVEVLSGGVNLPIRAPTLEQGFLETVFTPQIELLGIYAFHMWMFFHLVAWSLIHWDGLQVPRRYALFVLSLSIIAGAVYPWLHPAPAFIGPTSGLTFGAAWANQALTGSMGALMGILLGNEFDIAWSGRRQQATWFLGLVGAHLGWQAAFAVAVLATFAMIGGVLWRQVAPGGKPWPIGAIISISALLQLVFWKQSSEQLLTWWPGPHTPLQAIALAGVFVVIVQFSARLAVGRKAAAHPRI